MSSITAGHVAPKQGASDIAAHPAFLPLLILLALSLGLLLTYNGVVAVWRNGTIHDPDDAMRLVQVRALLAGQNWFDMSVYRLDPPGGNTMHWSRIVDVPLAVLIKMFGLVLPVEQAERLTRIVFPLLLQATLYAAMARLAKSLLGRDAIMPAIFLVLFSGIAFGQFQPGRIDHHAPQIVLLAFMLGGLVEAIKSQRMVEPVIAGGLAALSLAISLENMPFIFVLWGLSTGLWIWKGQLMLLPMRGFALGLLIGLPLCFGATVGPDHWFMSVPDAFSFGQLMAGMTGALLCLGLSFLPLGLSRGIKFMLALAGAIFILGLVGLVGPQSLHGPFAGIDPLIRDIWLSNVHEAWTFLRLAKEERDSAAVFMLPLLLGSAASIAAAVSEKGPRRLQWIMVAAISLTGIAMGLWLVRVLTSIGPTVPLGGVWAAMRLNKRLVLMKARTASLWYFFALLPFASIPWAIVIGGDEKLPKKPTEDCHASSAFASLARLPPGLILAPIDAGSHLLAFTPHSVLAAPYHRNNHGNKVALEAFLASPDDARKIVIGSGAKYLAVCAGLGETSVLGERDPRNLASAVTNGQIPDWLQPVSAANTPYKIFTVRP